MKQLKKESLAQIYDDLTNTIEKQGKLIRELTSKVLEQDQIIDELLSEEPN